MIMLLLIKCNCFQIERAQMRIIGIPWRLNLYSEVECEPKSFIVSGSILLHHYNLDSLCVPWRNSLSMLSLHPDQQEILIQMFNYCVH